MLKICSKSTTFGENIFTALYPPVLIDSPFPVRVGRPVSRQVSSSAQPRSTLSGPIQIRQPDNAPTTIESRRLRNQPWPEM